jgi:hypothetical protein
VEVEEEGGGLRESGKVKEDIGEDLVSTGSGGAVSRGWDCVRTSAARGGIGETISNSVPWIKVVLGSEGEIIWDRGCGTGLKGEGEMSRCGDLVGRGGGVLTGIERAVTKLDVDPLYSVEKPGVFGPCEGEGESPDLLRVDATGELEGVMDEGLLESGSTSRRDLDRISTSLLALPIGLPPLVEAASPMAVPPSAGPWRTGVEWS